MYDALYARQSVEKADSISVESQLEYCRYETRGNMYREYTDKGYSGKSTNRPAFEEMMRDVRQGKISRVIVYKLDRISRSILDFAGMMAVFEKYNVEFISSTERFDTSTPIGRAMLSICIVFAQLERETIQKRVADAYYSRCKRGFYMGGRIPYGFSRAKTVIDGITTSMYVPIEKEAEQIRLMYSLYAKRDNSLGDIVNYLATHGMKHLRGGVWNTARISEILRNPIYVKADADVYCFFKDCGANIVNPVSDFTGENACYLYRGASSNGRKHSDIEGKDVVLAPHGGIVASGMWIECRRRSLDSQRSTATCKPKNSWLSGKVKCGKCGYGLSVVKANTRHHRYFVCGASLTAGKSLCTGTRGTVYADVLEEYVSEAIRNRLCELGHITRRHEKGSTAEINANKIRISEIDAEIGELLTKVPYASGALIEHINNRVEMLDTEKRKLQDKTGFIPLRNGRTSGEVIKAPDSIWKNASFEDRQATVDVLIKIITVADGNIEITWNI